MKRTVAVLLMLIVASIAMAKSVDFTIRGSVKGLEKGDTLRFEKVLLPEWQMELAFEIVVGRDGVFTYCGSHDHTQYYLMRYFPAGDTPRKEADRRGLPILIGSGQISIDGLRDEIYYARLSGGFYDKQLNEVQALEDSLSLERSALIPLMQQKFKDRDTVAGRALEEQFNSFSLLNSEHYKRLRALQAAYTASHPNEYTASALCQVSWKPIAELESGYSSLTPEAKRSHYGGVLLAIIEKLKSLEPGQYAPDFTLATLGGETISLESFKGKYLIIYHFGMCPGSMQVDESVSELYNTHSDKLDVLGITQSMVQLEQVCAGITEGTTVMGRDFKKVMTGMTNHPWKHEAEIETGANKQIESQYNIQGLPFFIVISPEGKILARGYHEAFQEAKKIIANL